MNDVPTVPLKCALTIATSDSGSGAGIQADLKTFAALKVYGLCVISAVTAQNTVAVTGMSAVPPDLVTAQLEAVFDDIPFSAVKIGLLGPAENTLAVYNFLSQKCSKIPVVVDPVMVSTSGHNFLSHEEIAALKTLMKRALLVTPNLPEAEFLSGISITSHDDYFKAAENILNLGPANVLIKGGHSQGGAADDLFSGSKGAFWIKGEKIKTPHTHGTGCSLSAAIAANLAQGHNLKEAVELAKNFVAEGLRHGLNLGKGSGPLNHFYNYYHFQERT